MVIDSFIFRVSVFTTVVGNRQVLSFVCSSLPRWSVIDSFIFRMFVFTTVVGNRQFYLSYVRLYHGN